ARLVHGAGHEAFLFLEDADAAAETGLRIVIAQMAAGITFGIIAIFGACAKNLVGLLGGEPDAAVGTNDDDGVNLALGADAAQALAGRLLLVDDALHEERAGGWVEDEEPGVTAVARGADVDVAIESDRDGGVAGAVGRGAEGGEHDPAT